MESEPILRVSRLLEPLLQEGLDSFLGRWSLDGGHAGIPAGSHFDVGRQAGFVHEALGVRDRPLVERGDPGCENVLCASALFSGWWPAATRANRSKREPNDRARSLHC